MAEHLALARGGKNDELVREVAADRPGIGAHRDRLQAHPGEGAQVGDEHAVVGMPRAGLVEVEGIGVLHQEFARAHDAEPRPHLVAELPLDMVEVERQVLVGADRGAEDLGDHLLVRGPEQHVALVPVADPQHLLAIGFVAARFAPEIGGLDRRHEELDGAGAVLLLADDGIDPVEHAQAERQPGVDPGGLLSDQPGPQHEPVRDDLGLFRGLAEDGQEIAAQTHGMPFRLKSVRLVPCTQHSRPGKDKLRSRRVASLGMPERASDCKTGRRPLPRPEDGGGWRRSPAASKP